MIKSEYNKMDILLFQHRLYDLELGDYDVFQHKDFCSSLNLYLQRLIALGRKDVLTRVLVKIGVCASSHQDQQLRGQALTIVTGFTSQLKGYKDRELFRLAAGIIAGWLQFEKETFSDQKQSFSQIQRFIRRMISLQLWSQSEQVVAVTRKISEGKIKVSRGLKEDVCKLHRDIADTKAIDSMVQCLHEQRDPRMTDVAKLLVALVPHSSDAMIRGLFKSSKKKCRLALLEMIPEGSEGVLPAVIRKLRDRQPWYVIRNSMILLGSLEDPDIYHLVRPFLGHPDERVQREGILCIVKSGGDKVSHRLIESFPRVSDSLKPLIVEQLLSFSGEHVEKLYLDCLQQRSSFSPETGEHLVRIVCSSNKLQNSQRALGLLQTILEEMDSASYYEHQTLEIVRSAINELEPVEHFS